MNCFIITSFIISILLLDTSVAKVTKDMDTLKYKIRQPHLNKHTLDLLDTSPIFDIKNLNAKANNEIRIDKNELFLGKSFDNLTIQFYRKSPIWTVTWILAKYKNMKNIVMLSENNGIDTIEYNKFDDYSPSTQIDDIFANPADSKFLIFSDKLNKVLFITSTNGIDLSASQISFEPARFIFTQKPRIFVALDSQDQLWLTVNTGSSWKLISEHLIVQCSDVVSFDKRTKNEYIYFLEVDGRLIRFDLSGFQQDFSNENVAEHRHVISENVSDFAIVENHVYMMKKNLNETNKMELIVSKELSSEIELVGLEFKDASSQLLSFQVTMVTDSEVFIVVTYKELNNQIKNDLYQSVSKSLKFLKFKPSLKNIINRCETVNSGNSTLDLNNNQCVEIRSLKTGHYLANAINDKSKRVETLVKLSTDSKWLPVSFYDLNDRAGPALNLNDNFFQIHLDPEGSFRQDSVLPDRIVAAADSDVYLSSDEGSDWERIDFGKNNGNTYSYSVSHKVMFAVDTTKPVNNFLYSFDYGNTWQEYFFSNRLVLVSEIISDPSEDFNVFYLAFTRSNSQQSLIRIHFRPKQLNYYDPFDGYVLDHNQSPIDPLPVNEKSTSTSTATTTFSTTAATTQFVKEEATETTPVADNLHELEKDELVKKEATQTMSVADNLHELEKDELVKIEEEIEINTELRDPVSIYYQISKESHDQVIKVCLFIGMILLVATILILVWTWLKNRKTISRYCVKYYKEFVDREQKVLWTQKNLIVKKEAEEYLIQKETEENKI